MSHNFSKQRILGESAPDHPFFVFGGRNKGSMDSFFIHACNQFLPSQTDICLITSDNTDATWKSWQFKKVMGQL